jgi:hypothetical protein
VAVEHSSSIVYGYGKRRRLEGHEWVGGRHGPSDPDPTCSPSLVLVSSGYSQPSLHQDTWDLGPSLEFRCNFVRHCGSSNKVSQSSVKAPPAVGAQTGQSSQVQPAGGQILPVSSIPRILRNKETCTLMDLLPLLPGCGCHQKCRSRRRERRAERDRQRARAKVEYGNQRQTLGPGRSQPVEPVEPS